MRNDEAPLRGGLPLATKKQSKRGQTRRKTTRAHPIDDALARLERDIPRLLRQLRTSVKDLRTQVERARSDGEKRWAEAERKVKRDAAQLRQRLERAIGRMRGGAKAAKARAAKAVGVKAKATKRRASPRKRRTT
jgi:hypothetical protein